MAVTSCSVRFCTNIVTYSAQDLYEFPKNEHERATNCLLGHVCYRLWSVEEGEMGQMDWIYVTDSDDDSAEDGEEWTVGLESVPNCLFLQMF